MNRKQKIIVSITGIFIVLLALVGLTYAYFLTRIRSNEKDKSISVTTANLELVYGNDDGSIIGDGELIEPDTTFETKTFTVTNNGNATVDNYAVILEDVKTYYNQAFIDENNTPVAAGTQVAFERPEDFEIAISCKITASPTTANIGKDCTGYTGTLPLMESETLDETYITNGILVNNSIEVGETQTYSVVLKYIEANTNQSDDMNKRLEGKFNIIDANNTVDITGKLENVTGIDAIVTNSVRRESQINSDGSYKIVGLEADVHSIKKKSGNTETEIGKISIVKGKNAGVGTTDYNGVTIPEFTITDASRLATIDINTTNNTLNPSNEIKSEINWNNAPEGTLLYAIKRDNEVKVPESTPGKEPIKGTYTMGSVPRSFREHYSNLSYYSADDSDANNGIVSSCEQIIGLEMTVYVGDDDNQTSLAFLVEECDGEYAIGSQSLYESIFVGEALLAKTEDNYGNSYYFRGMVENNFVNFNNMCWRIVRVQGNGGIKLILADSENMCNEEGYRLYNEESGVISPVSSLNKFNFNETQSSKVLNNWLNEKTFDKNYLDESLWCYDISIREQIITPRNEYIFNEETEEEIYIENDTEYIFGGTNTPNLKCNYKGINNSSSKLIKSYIALLTRDEVMYAGGIETGISNYYILSNLPFSKGDGMALLNPYYFTQYNLNAPGIYFIGSNGQIFSRADSGGFIRPSIVLKSNVLATTNSDTDTYGEPGTQTNPYVIGTNLAS